MKVRSSVKADPLKGDRIVKRKGRVYVINKKDPTRKQRQAGPAKKKQGYMARKALIEKEKKRAKLIARKYEVRQELKKIIRSLTASDEAKKEVANEYGNVLDDFEEKLDELSGSEKDFLPITTKAYSRSPD